jgi:hypothetical protein
MMSVTLFKKETGRDEDGNGRRGIGSHLICARSARPSARSGVATTNQLISTGSLRKDHAGKR